MSDYDDEVDGNGGWWLCNQCKELAAHTMPSLLDNCSNCGCPHAGWYPDGEYK